MLRSSTLGGGLKHNDHQEDPLDQGIQADMVITEPDESTSAGISYTIRFLKDWEYGVTSHQGEKLPLSYDGTDTLAFELETQRNARSAYKTADSKKKTNSIRHRIMEVISFAHQHKLLAWINCKTPTAASQKLDNWLAEQADMGNPRGHFHEDHQTQLPQGRSLAGPGIRNLDTESHQLVPLEVRGHGKSNIIYNRAIVVSIAESPPTCISKDAETTIEFDD